MKNIKTSSVKHVALCLVFYASACVENSSALRLNEKSTLLHSRVTTRYQAETVYIPVSSYSKTTQTLENKTETPPTKKLESELKFPDGENINLMLGQVFLISPCKTTEIDLKQVFVTGGDLGSFADIICRDRGQKEKKAHFTCPGKELEFRTDINPYQLICVK